MSVVAPWIGLSSIMKFGKWSPEQLAAWTYGFWTSLPSQGVSGVTQDTRNLSEGDLYVALRGHNFDGHHFLSSAFESGASAALVDVAWVKEHGCDFPCLVVPDTHQALTQLAQNYRSSWSSKVIGVTGSVGKTTVKELIAQMLATQGRVCLTPGNYNNDIGVPLSILGATGKEDFGVFEIAMNQPGEIGPLTDLVHPRVGVVTPVGSAHVGQFEDEEAVASEKAALVERVDRNGFCVLSADLPWFDLLSSKSAAPVVTVALEGEANWTGRWTDEGFEIRLEDNPVLTCSLPVRAEFMARNVLLATAVACRLGVGVKEMKQAIESFQAPGMRWAQSSIRGIEWINDSYNANPLSMQAALEALDRLSVPGKKWAVLGGMRELGDHEQRAHEELGASLLHYPNHCVAVGACANWIVEGALSAGVPAHRIHLADCHADAVALLRDLVNEGDAVLLKASRAERLEQILDQWDRATRD